MRIGLIGAGNMARALARGWGEPIVASDSGSGRAQRLVDELGGEAVAENGSVERLEWMSRTLLGNGFVPSGIPAEAGRLAFRRLQSLCPR